MISGYGWSPIPNSAWMAYELLAPLAAIGDLDWIAAVGTLSDLGDQAPWAELPSVKKRYTAKALKEAVALVNAARRARAFDTGTPLELLMEAGHPKTVAADPERGARLRAYRAEVKLALDEARKRAPVFAVGGPFAMIELHSACQIHPLVAQQWRSRLPKYAVIAANSGYLPGIVAFSARTARTDLDLPRLLRAVDVGAGAGATKSFGYGHDQASGGQLPPEAFARLLDALGFDGRARLESMESGV